jgi:hypothetical protein
MGGMILKKIISYLLLCALVFNVFVINTFAEETTTISADITFTKNSKGELDNDGNVEIEIESESGKDLFIEILDLDDNSKIVYVETLLKDENEGTHKIVLKKQDLGFKNFKLIVSDGNTTEEFKFEVERKRTASGSGGGNSTESTENHNKGWNDTKKTDTETKTEVDSSVDSLTEGKNALDSANSQTTIAGAEQMITDTTKATSDKELAEETTRNIIAVAAETMISNIGATTLRVDSKNTLKLDSSAIKNSDWTKYDNTVSAINNSISKNNITLNRELSNEFILNVTFDKNEKAKITITADMVEQLKKKNVDTLTVKDSDFKISYTVKELEEMLGDKDEVSFEIDKSAMSDSTKKISVNFDTDKTQTVKISFPGLSGDTKYMAIVDENGNPVGGRYNPATGVIEAKISESGIYQLVNNEKDFEDIKSKSEEMQESIKILAAKGVIEGTSETEFSPDSTITRAEIAALILRVLSQIDPNADGEFSDVKKSDWFYGTAGSSKNYGLIVGYEDNTFRGNNVIEKDQILTIASRVLQKEMKYKMPEKTEEWLTFSDSDEIADWARNDIALATMANIITRTEDNTINASEDMTRGDAALIIMRLFYKVW